MTGSNKRFPVVKEAYVTDAEDMAKRSVLDGDAFLPGASGSWRFRSRETEPYMPSQGKGLPWFTVNKVRARARCCGGAGRAGWQSLLRAAAAASPRRHSLLRCRGRGATLSTPHAMHARAQCTPTRNARAMRARR